MKKLFNLKFRSLFIFDIILIALVFIAIFAIGSVFDLDFSEAIAISDNIGWMILSFVFTLPLYMCFAIAISCLFVVFIANDKKKWWFYVTGMIIVFIVSIVLMVMDIEEILSMSGAIASTSVIYLISIIIAVTIELVLLTTSTYMTKNKNSDQLFRVGLFLIIALGVSILFTIIIKYVWGRARYNDILNSGATFTNWWNPNFNEMGVYKSFPSGHVNKAMAIFPLVSTLMIFYPSLAKHTYNALLTYGALLFVLLAAFIRVLSGNHFLTDVSMSMILSGIVYLVTAYFVYVFHYQKKVTD